MEKHFTRQREFWSENYYNDATPWDLSGISTPLKSYFDQLTDKNLSILIPGAGLGHEAAYLHHRGFTEVTFMDFSEKAAKIFRENNPSFPENRILTADFFEFNGQYDLIVEQTFFCAFEPSREMREQYAEKMHDLIREDGKLVGLWWDFPLNPDKENPPYGGSYAEYISLFKDIFTIETFEKCYNSMPERQDLEFFGILQKKNQ